MSIEPTSLKLWSWLSKRKYSAEKQTPKVADGPVHFLAIHFLQPSPALFNSFQSSSWPTFPVRMGNWSPIFVIPTVTAKAQEFIDTGKQHNFACSSVAGVLYLHKEEEFMYTKQWNGIRVQKAPRMGHCSPQIHAMNQTASQCHHRQPKISVNPLPHGVPSFVTHLGAAVPFSYVWNSYTTSVGGSMTVPEMTSSIQGRNWGSAM